MQSLGQNYGQLGVSEQINFSCFKLETNATTGKKKTARNVFLNYVQNGSIFPRN